MILLIGTFQSCGAREKRPIWSGLTLLHANRALPAALLQETYERSPISDRIGRYRVPPSRMDQIVSDLLKMRPIPRIPTIEQRPICRFDNKTHPQGLISGQCSSGKMACRYRGYRYIIHLNRVIPVCFMDNASRVPVYDKNWASYWI